MPEVILSAQNLVKHYPIRTGILRRTTGHVKAVDGVSFELHKGETLGIVGESGCGKSTLGRLLMRLEDPTSGTVTFGGEDWSTASGSKMRRLRRDIQIVFQDPYTSLNPRMTVGDIVGEPFEIHADVVPKGGRRKRVQELLDLVGLNPEHINRYPHQFSGGQRQRIGIARGIALNPKVLVCDEPVSALDVSVQAQVVNLMEKLQDELGLAYVFIAHDLSVVRHISDRVGVMYLGRMAELGEEDEVYSRPTHPYTQALLSAVPVPDPTLRGRREQIVLVGDVPSPANPPSGCRFHTRCFKAQEVCSVEDPAFIPRHDGRGEHLSACHFAEPRVIVETVDVSDEVPDARFTTTEVVDLDERFDGPTGVVEEKSDLLHDEEAVAAQDRTRLVDEQPDDHRPPTA
jgi:oligopeptide transport system ATP-binding protein